MATLRADPPIGQASTLRRVQSADLRYLVVNDLQSAIAAAALKTPIQIVLDDIHWADHATLLAVRSLTAGLAGAPVLWVLATRAGAGGPAVGPTVNMLEHDGAGCCGWAPSGRPRWPTSLPTSCARKRMRRCSVWPTRRTATRSW